MEFAYQALRVGHIAVATLSLVALVPPLVAKKGGALHRQAGKVFVVAMTLTALTGIAIAATWLAGPTAGKRASAVFLFVVGAQTLSSIRHGLRALALRNKPAAAAKMFPLDVALHSILAASALALFAFAALAKSPLFFVFAAIGLFIGASHLHRTIVPPRERMGWWYEHMSGMLTAVVGAITAFSVVGAGRAFGALLPDAWRIVPWIAPPLVLVPSFQAWIRYYRRRFGDATGTAAAQSTATPRKS